MSKRSNYENDILPHLYPNFSWELFKIHATCAAFVVIKALISSAIEYISEWINWIKVYS